jgi:hypothetical protein
MDAGMDGCIQSHPELKSIIDQWAILPDHIKAAIMALIQTAVGKS